MNTKIPEKGFYYHFKHDPKKDIYNYAYWVLPVLANDADNPDEPKVSYLRLYKEPNNWFRKFVEFFDKTKIERPENVTNQLTRFVKINDPELCEKLKERFYEMYPDLLP